MKLRNALIASIAFAAVPTLANAEPFNGAYVGAQAGWDNHKTIGNGISYGIIGGYNAKIGEKAVIGLEGNYDFSSATKKQTSVIGGSTVSAEANIGRSLGIAGRLGILAAPSTLFYVKGGYENISAKISTTGISGFDKLSGKIDAAVVGGGVEHAFNETTSFRINYDYANGQAGYNRHRLLAGVAFHF
jgi:outer membrane immunogenic protein